MTLEPSANLPPTNAVLASKIIPYFQKKTPAAANKSCQMELRNINLVGPDEEVKTGCE